MRIIIQIIYGIIQKHNPPPTSTATLYSSSTPLAGPQVYITASQPSPFNGRLMRSSHVPSKLASPLSRIQQTSKKWRNVCYDQSTWHIGYEFYFIMCHLFSFLEFKAAYIGFLPRYWPGRDLLSFSKIIVLYTVPSHQIRSWVQIQQ